MPDNVDITRDAPRLPQNAPDPNVHIPPSVAAAAAAAEAAHQQAYAPPAPQVTEPVTPELPVSTIAETPSDPKHADRASWTAEQWRHHALSTEGRYKAQQATLHQMQDQAAQLAEELIRTQALKPQQQQPTHKVEPLLTAQDEEQFGKDLIDFAKRAALEAVQPELVTLRQQNEQLQKRISKNTVSTVSSVLDQQVPNWRDINVSPEFNSWLNLRDVYSGNVRRNLLKAAHDAADAARVSAFFQGYLNEMSATGALETLPFISPAAVPPTAPRQAAVPLATLTAPGQARPAVGSAPTDASKPILTHAQIAKFYDNVRKGVYRGREADQRNDEQVIFEAQREGRVR